MEFMGRQHAFRSFGCCYLRGMRLGPSSSGEVTPSVIDHQGRTANVERRGEGGRERCVADTMRLESQLCNTSSKAHIVIDSYVEHLEAVHTT